MKQILKADKIIFPLVSKAEMVKAIRSVMAGVIFRGIAMQAVIWSFLSELAARLTAADVTAAQAQAAGGVFETPIATDSEKPLYTSDEIGVQFCAVFGLNPDHVREISIHILPGEDLLVDVQVRLVPYGLETVDWAALARAARVVVQGKDEQ